MPPSQPEACLPSVPPDPRTVAGYVHRRTDTPPAVKEPPKSKRGAGKKTLNRGGGRKRSNDHGDDSSEEDDDRNETLKTADEVLQNGISVIELSHYSEKINYYDQSVDTRRRIPTQLELNDTWAKGHMIRLENQKRRAARENTLIGLCPKTATSGYSLAEKCASIRRGEALLYEYCKLLLSEQQISKLRIEVVADIEAQVLSRLGTSRMFSPLVLDETTLSSSKGENRRLLLAHIMEKVLKNPSTWHAASLALLSLILNHGPSKLPIDEYLEKMLGEAADRSSPNTWSGFRFEELRTLEPLLEEKVLGATRLYLETHDHGFYSIGGELQLLIRVHPRLLRWHVVPPEIQAQCGWYQGRDHPDDQKYWRYRVGTESGDESYVFEVSLDEEVIGIWTPDGDIYWNGNRGANADQAV